MNRRIVLIDQNETPNIASFYGIGLGEEIYTLQALNSMDPDDLYKYMMSLGKGDAIMLVGGEPFKFLQQFRHAGVRSENYFDCSKLYRLSWEGDLYTKIVLETPTPEEVQEFMSEDFTKDVDFSWFKSKVIHTLRDAHKFFDWLEKLPENEYLGYDVESSGMSLDKWFELSGFSICNLKYGAFVSLTDIRHNSTQEEYGQLMSRIGQFLDKRQDHLVTYNSAYEQSASHRMFGVYLYNLLDASVANVLDGEHYKKLSLKHTAQRVLKAKVWDTEFDWISDTIDSMLYMEEGKLKKDKHKVLKVTPETFENTDEWKAICTRYPDYVDEFRSLVLEYFGNAFMVIPSEILGKYCNLDAFYTLMIFETKRKEYSEDAIRTFMDNARLGAVLHNCGLYIDEPFRQEYSDYCREMMAIGITTCAQARCYIKMEKHKKLMAKIDKYSDIAKKLLYSNKFFNGDPIEITKYILTSNVDHLNSYELGLDEGKLLLEFGPDFAEQFIEKTREAMEEAEMIKLYKKTGEKVLKKKIDDTVGGKKKLIQLLSQKIIPLIGLDKIKINNKHIELEKYLYYERAYNELVNISKTQLNDINNLPKTVRGFGMEFTNLEDYANYVSDNYFKNRSPLENDAICLEFAELYKAESAYLAALLESTQQLNNAEKFYSDLGIDTIDKAFEHFASEYNRVYNGEAVENTSYPAKIYTLFDKFYKDPGCDEVKEIWSNFNGYVAQEQFFGYVTDQYQEYGKPFKPEDLNNRFFFMRKLVINYLLNKKYAKVLSTYIDGLFNEGEWVIEDKRYNFPIRKADPNEPGAVKKCFSKYEVNTKSSKRWSSAFHTIISHADFKDIIRTPYHYDNFGNIVDEDFIETYFDISSAEVKSAGFASGDPDLIDKFNKGEDIYVYSAKLYLGDKFDKLDKKQKRMWRKRFKTVFLGVLYGLGKKSLAERLNCSEQEAEHIIQGLYTSFPKLREYIAGQQQYIFDNKGYINSILGDKLKVKEYELWEKAKDRWEKNNLKARCERLAVNLPIQGGTASIMSSGFFNNIRESIQDWDIPLQPIIVVHDSNTNYVPTKRIFEIRKFYDKYYTDFCASFGPKIKLLFDLLAGDAYECAMPMKTIDDNTIEFTGSAYSMIRMYKKIMNCKELNVECSVKPEDLVPNWVVDPVLRFIMEKGTCLRKDISSYTVQFRKLS